MGQTNLLGYATGLACFNLSSNTFVPGAMADSMDSFGGIIFGPNDHTSLLAFIKAGAAGSYGTVTEPTPNTQKFPNPQNYFYQGRGFSLAECYYQSLYIPFQGLIVAEPLAAPFTRLASGSWVGVASNAVLSGTAQLGVAFCGTDAKHLLQQIDLFVDGKYWQTLTNRAPGPGNVLNVALNGYPLTYTVPTNATLATVASGLATLLNAPATTNLTRVAAQAYGDRVELRSLASNSLAIPFYFTASGATNPASRYYRAQYLSDSARPWLAGLGRTNGGAFRLRLETPAGMPSFVQASTDLVTWITILTNLAGGPLDMVDAAASGYSKRFYRIVQTPSDPRPQVAPVSFGNGVGFRLRVSTASTTPCVIQASTNLVDWTSVYTNSSGGTADFIDAGAVNSARRFYRALACPQTPALPALSVQTSTNADGTLVRVEGATQPFVILESANQVQWTPVFTNFAAGQVQTVASSSSGGADALTTSLTASRSTFLDSVANGLRTFNVTGTIAVGAWLQLNVTKTNGAAFSLSVTNLSAGATLFDLAQQLVTAINSSPALLGGDGLVAEDLAAGAFGTASFNLRARGPGRDAAAIQVRLITSASLGASPSAPMRLDVNFSDLRSRNHLYVAAGASQLASNFPLDTTRLADGFHELTAVAYEGTHVRTQTRITLPVQIRNTSLSASLTLLDLADPAPAQGTYHVEVAANTNNVSAISLFSTGGLLGTVTNQSVATFTIDGSALSAGAIRVVFFFFFAVCFRLSVLHDTDEAAPYGQEPGTFTPGNPCRGSRPAVLRRAARRGGDRPRSTSRAPRPADRRRARHQPRMDPEAAPRHEPARLFHGSGDRHHPAPHARLRELHRARSFRDTHVNFQRVPMVDTSNPFIARDIPRADESMVVIRFRNPRASTFQYLLVDGSRQLHVARQHHRGARAARWSWPCSSSSRPDRCGRRMRAPPNARWEEV